MDISITARHLEISDDLRDYIEEKVAKFERYVDRIIDVKVVLQKEKDRVSADITMQVHDYKMHGQETTHDVYGSIDQVLDKMERQLRKYKEKMQDRRGKHTIRKGAEEAPAAPSGDEVVRNTLNIKPMCRCRSRSYPERSRVSSARTDHPADIR